MYNLKGKTAWITGGKRIGRRIAEVLAQNGANIVLSYNKSRKEAEETEISVKKLGVKSLILQTNVSDRQEVNRAVKVISEKFGKLDILVLMASIFDKIKLEDITDEDLQKNFDVHVKGTFWPIRESLGILPKGAHIITITDRTALGRMYREYLPYIITKGSVAYLTQELALELGSKGIFINSIAPGPILKPNDLPQKDWDEIRKKSIISNPITDEEAVEEFAKLILYLSEARSTGSVYPLDLGHI